MYYQYPIMQNYPLANYQAGYPISYQLAYPSGYPFHMYRNYPQAYPFYNPVGLSPYESYGVRQDDLFDKIIRPSTTIQKPDSMAQSKDNGEDETCNEE